MGFRGGNRRPPGGDPERRRRRRFTLYVSITVLALLIWIFGVVLVDLGTGGGGSSEQAKGAKHHGGGASTIKAPRKPPPGGKVRIGGGPNGEPGAVKAAHPNEFVRKLHQLDRKKSGEPSVPKGGVSEPSYDPLGVSGKLSPIDKERIQSTVSKFISTAYGYTGKGWNPYFQQLQTTVLSGDFFGSAAGEQIKHSSDRIENRGIKSAAKLDEFHITSSSKDSARGIASFSTATSYDHYGNLEASQKHYRQQLFLKRYEAAWRIDWATKPQEE